MGGSIPTWLEHVLQRRGEQDSERPLGHVAHGETKSDRLGKLELQRREHADEPLVQTDERLLQHGGIYGADQQRYLSREQLPFVYLVDICDTVQVVVPQVVLLVSLVHVARSLFQIVEARAGLLVAGVLESFHGRYGVCEHAAKETEREAVQCSKRLQMKATGLRARTSAGRVRRRKTRGRTECGSLLYTTINLPQ